MRVMTLMLKGVHFVIICRVRTIHGMAYNSIHLLLRKIFIHSLPPQHVRVIPMQLMVCQVLMVLPLVRVALLKYNYTSSTI